jgi:hypothetical protein
MKQILHIFAKDARHFWPEILISLALLMTFVWVEPSTWLVQIRPHAMAVGWTYPNLEGTAFLAALLPLFIVLSWWLLIARVAHAEALVGDRQFWVTQPYEWKMLLSAKLLFLLVFLYLPLLIARCVLLLLAGFHPSRFVPELLYSLLLITGVLVLPLFAITTVTATFARLTLTLLAGLACFTAYLAVALYFAEDGGVPVGDFVSLPLTLCVCLAVVVLQYALRRVWISRFLLIAIPLLLFLSDIVFSDSAAVQREFPRPSGGQAAPVQLALLKDPRKIPDAYLKRAKRVQVNIPLQVSGVAEGNAVLTGPVQVTVEAPNGARWTSPWALSHDTYAPGTDDSWISFQMNRAFFDRVSAVPVTLHVRVGLTKVRAGKVRSIPLPAEDFLVPDFGFCSPQVERSHRQYSGVACRFAMHQPWLTYITVHWEEGSCSASQSPTMGVLGDAWTGSLEHDPAEFGISPVVNPAISLSNSTKGEGSESEPRHLCPGTPVIFTQYDFAGKTEYDFSIPDFRLPSYQPDEGGAVGSTSFDIRAK